MKARETLTISDDLVAGFTFDVARLFVNQARQLIFLWV